MKTDPTDPNNSFEAKMRQKLAPYEAPVPPLLWEEVAKEMHPMSLLKNKRRYLWGIAAAAALSGLVWMLPLQNMTDSLPDAEIISSSNAAPESSFETGEPLAIVSSQRSSSREQTPREHAFKRMTASSLPSQVACAAEGETAVAVLHSIQPGGSPEPQTEHSSDKGEKSEDFSSTEISPKQISKNKSAYTEYPPNALAAISKKDAPFSIGISASNLPASANGRSNFPGEFQQYGKLMAAFALPNEVEYKHDMPLTFGITLSKEFASRWSIETGLSYYYLHARYSSDLIQGKQNLHYLGIPVSLAFEMISWKHLTLYVGAGGWCAVNIAGNYQESMRNQMKASAGLLSLANTDNSLSDRTQWGIQAKAGISYRLHHWAHLYLEPSLNYAFDNGSQTQTYWKKRPWNFALQLGIRFSL